MITDLGLVHYGQLTGVDREFSGFVFQLSLYNTDNVWCRLLSLIHSVRPFFGAPAVHSWVTRGRANQERSTPE